MEVDNIIFIIFSPHNKQILENRSPAVRVQGPLYLVLRKMVPVHVDLDRTQGPQLLR